MRLIQILLGIVLGLPATAALVPLIAAFRPSAEAVADGATGAFSTFWLIWLLLAGIIALARSLIGSLGRGVTILGFAVLALPLSLTLATGRAALDTGGLLPGLVTGLFGGILSVLGGIAGIGFGVVLVVAGLFILAAAPSRSA